jgi:hypothetical protein
MSHLQTPICTTTPVLHFLHATIATWFLTWYDTFFVCYDTHLAHYNTLLAYYSCCMLLTCYDTFLTRYFVSPMIHYSSHTYDRLCLRYKNHTLLTHFNGVLVHIRVRLCILQRNFIILMFKCNYSPRLCFDLQKSLCHTALELGTASP